ncbi:MAG: ATP-dependent DNA helicase RecG, partial [Candidatus Pelagibacter sp.]|nr:ATP-dependent DNA helicase RecG [Candidatus Pelagibacter sp.]
MVKTKKNEYIFSDVSKIKGVGKRLAAYLKNKKIDKIKDLLWDMPYSYTDRSKSVKLDELQVGTIPTIKVRVIKYNFPRIRNLPNKITCEDEKGKIDIIFFNSREGYIR